MRTIGDTDLGVCGLEYDSGYFLLPLWPGLVYQFVPNSPEGLLEFEMAREANHDISRSCST